MQARREEQPRQIPVFGKESQEASKQEKSSSDWSSEQSGLGLQERSKQHQQEWEEQSRRRQWESEKGIGDTYGSTGTYGTTGQGLGQQYEQQFEKGQFDKGFGGQGVGGQQSEQGLGVGQHEKGQFDKGIGQQYSKELGAGDPGAQQFDKGYQQESDYGQKSHEWKQKTLAKDPEQLRQYGEKPFEEVQGGKKHHIPIGSGGKGEWGSGQTSHSDWGVTGQQEREQQLQSEEARNKETCKSKEITGKEKQICPKEKEKEACQYKEPCSTHQKAIRTGTEQQEDLTKTQKQEETSGALPVAQPVGEKGEQTREGKDEEREERQRHKLDPKLKEEIEQCKDSRFNNIMQLMHTTKAKALLDSHKPLVTVSDSTSINEALVTLNENDLSSAPVLNHEGEFMGFIDMLGITGFTMCLYKKLCQQKGGSPLEGRGQQQQKLAITRMEEWKNETVGSLISKGHLPKDHHSLHGSSNLYEAFELMARTRQHRIALTGKRNEVIGVLTQSMMMEFLYDHKKDLEAVGEILVLRLRPYTFLATVKEDEPAVHAFETMAKQKVSGLAVVNKEGQLVDGISVRDLRGVCSGAGCDFNTLHKSVKQFRKCVTKAKKEFKWTGQLVVKNEDNFETVLEKLVKLHAHRVFVIDREQKPVDVITGSSIMAMVLHCAFPPSHWGPLT